MKEIHLHGKPFNLGYSLDCGQVFRWRREGSFWKGIVEGKSIKARQTGGKIFFESRLSNEFVEKYFRLDDELGFFEKNILESCEGDERIAAVFKKYRGLRLVRQEPWECLASFVLSQQSSIPLIAKRIEALSRRFGEKISPDEYAFPTADALACEGEACFRKMNFGYRAGYLSETAREIAGGFDLKGLRRLGYEEAKKELKTLAGVGDKVADCVCLYGLGFLEAFPVDTHVEKIMREFYGKEIRAASQKAFGDFGRKKFGRFAGYAQQYLYYSKRGSKPQ